MTSIDCGEVLDIARVREMHQQCLAAIESGEPITLIAGSLQRIDGAGLQLLVALIIEAKKSGIEVNWGSPAAVLQQAAGYLGLQQYLGITGKAA